MSSTMTLEKTRDIIFNEMKDAFGTSAQDDIRDMLRLERATELECERRETDARMIIREMTERFEQQQRVLVVPSEEEFVEKVRGLEQERARTTYRIEEQMEEAAAKEKEIERMQGAAEDAEAEIERTVEAHTVEMPRVQNSIGLYAYITGIKWNYETEGDIMAGWILPRGGDASRGGGGAGDSRAASARDGAVVEGFQFDTAGKDDFEVANKLWDIIDGRARAMVEA